jgi:DNA invertase Pin-like site-specific DNA recombinase
MSNASDRKQQLHRRGGQADNSFSPGAASVPLDGYVRVSKVGGRTGERFISPDVQEEQIRAYATARGYTIDVVFHELDRSGTTFDRAILQQALDRIESRESGGLIVARLDRFARSALEALEAIARIQQAGGEFISVEDGLDSSTPFGKAMMTILLALAELEVGRVRENWYFAQAHAVLRGVHVTGRPPFGYRRGPTGRLEPIPAQAQHLRHAYVRRGFGDLLGEITTGLNKAGVRDDHGTPISLPRIHYVLRNPVYMGEARCGELINPSAHPALVSRSLWLAAQDPRTHTQFNRNVKTLLAGLLDCGGCGLPLKRLPLTDRNPAWFPEARFVYGCRSQPGPLRCRSRTFIADSLIEPYVVEAFFDWFQHLDRRSVHQRLDVAEQTVVEADRRYGVTLASSLSEQERAAARHTSEQAWAALATIARLALVLELPEARRLRIEWPTLGAMRQRHVLSTALKTVTVNRADASPAEGRTRISFIGEAVPI